MENLPKLVSRALRRTNQFLRDRSLRERTAEAHPDPVATMPGGRNPLIPREVSLGDMSLGADSASAFDQARARYLELLIRVLTNSIYEDPGMDPWSGAIYDDSNRAVGRDWPRQAHSMAGRARLENLRDLTQRTLDQNIPGDYIETGVWRGGCCILMKAVLEINGVKDRTVYVADSFQGLPPPKPDRFAVDTGDNLYTFDELRVSKQQVQRNFEKYSLLDGNVVFLEGFFEDTLPTLAADRFALLRLDGDMYQSTTEALESLYPKLSAGGFVIIDDYALPGCRQAVEDYRERHDIQAPKQEIDWTGIWWQKN